MESVERDDERAAGVVEERPDEEVMRGEDGGGREAGSGV